MFRYLLIFIAILFVVFLVAEYWPVVLLAAAAFLVWRYIKKKKEGEPVLLSDAEIRDAVSRKAGCSADELSDALPIFELIYKSKEKYEDELRLEKKGSHGTYHGIGDCVKVYDRKFLYYEIKEDSCSEVQAAILDELNVKSYVVVRRSMVADYHDTAALMIDYEKGCIYPYRLRLSMTNKQRFVRLEEYSIKSAYLESKRFRYDIRLYDRSMYGKTFEIPWSEISEFQIYADITFIIDKNDKSKTNFEAITIDCGSLTEMFAVFKELGGYGTSCKWNCTIPINEQYIRYDEIKSLCDEEDRRHPDRRIDDDCSDLLYFSHICEGTAEIDLERETIIYNVLPKEEIEKQIDEAVCRVKAAIESREV